MTKTLQVAPESDIGRMIRIAAATREPLVVEVGGDIVKLLPAGREGLGRAGESTDEPSVAVELRAIEEQIAASRSLLDLGDDWDDEGAVSYGETTWKRATSLLTWGVTRLWEDYGVRTERADVLPGPQGSIDLDWRAAGHELLINVPVDATKPAHYYGDDGAGSRKIKGTLDPGASNRWLLAWMAE